MREPENADRSFRCAEWEKEPRHLWEGVCTRSGWRTCLPRSPGSDQCLVVDLLVRWGGGSSAKVCAGCQQDDAASTQVGVDLGDGAAQNRLRIRQPGEPPRELVEATRCSRS